MSAKDRFWGWTGPAMVTLLAAFLRLNRLGVPTASDMPTTNGRIFDEVYYSCDAHSLLRFGVEHHITNLKLCVLGPGPGVVQHPPLGKWLIAAGEYVVGNNPYGWRISAAIVGSLAVLILARVARRMTGSTTLGTFAGLLLALDGLEFVQSRVAMLDIFLMFWLVAAFACLVADRESVRSRLASAPEAPSEQSWARSTGLPRMRLWRLGAGICLGAAAATKWSGAWYAIAFAPLALSWDLFARRAAGTPRWLRDGFRRDLPGVVLLVWVVPFIVYLLSWLGWFTGNAEVSFNYPHFRPHEDLLTRIGAVVGNWLDYQKIIYRSSQTLVTTNTVTHHPYESHWWQWSILQRPVSYFFAEPKFGHSGCHAAHGCAQSVVAIGTPAVWWAAPPALAIMLWIWIARSDWRSGAVVIGWAAGILPWIPEDLRHRTMFLFYALPAVPFMVLALTLTASAIVGSSRTSTAGRLTNGAIIGLYAMVVLVNFAYFYPVLAARVIPNGSWHARMWFHS